MAKNRSVLDDVMIMLFEDFDPAEEEDMIDGIYDRASDLLDLVIDPDDDDSSWEEYLVGVPEDDGKQDADEENIIDDVPLVTSPTVIDDVLLKSNKVVDDVPMGASTPTKKRILSTQLKADTQPINEVPLVTKAAAMDDVPLTTKAAVLDNTPLQIDQIIQDEKLKRGEPTQTFKLTTDDDGTDAEGDAEDDLPFGTTDPNTQMVISIRLLIQIRRILDRLIAFVNKDKTLSDTKEVVVQLLDVLSDEHESIVSDSDRTEKIAHQVYGLATSIKQYMKEKRSDLLDMISRKEDEANTHMEEKKVDVVLSNPTHNTIQGTRSNQYGSIQ